MTKTFAAFAALVAFAAPAVAQSQSPHVTSQIVSPNFEGNAAVADGSTTRAGSFDLRYVDGWTGDDSAPRVGQSDIFGAQSR